MTHRQRGVLLTEGGLARLGAAIAAAQDQEKFGQRFTQAELEARCNLSRKTIKKIRHRTAAVDETSVRALFSGFGLNLAPADYGLPASDTDPKTDTQSNADADPGSSPDPDPGPDPKTDWGEKPDTALFFGRTADRTTLGQWIDADRCRLIALLGMGGMGKTALAAKLADQGYPQFDYVIWRSLREAPPLDDLLVRLIQFLSDQQETEATLPPSQGERIIRLLHYLRVHRCLLVLDNLESMLQAGSAGQYRAGYENYGALLQQLGAADHQSCVLLTSRECPRELAPLAGERLPVRLWSVRGLDAAAGRAILQTKGLDLAASDPQAQALIQRYSGNPQALHLIATAIQREFFGDVADFLAEGPAAVDDVHSLLNDHLTRLTPLERSVLFWLAIHREPVGLEGLLAALMPPITKREVRGALRGLTDRYLIEAVGKRFTLQNVIMEFATERLVEGVCAELQHQQFDLFHRHALIQATAKDYVRDTQIRLVVRPILARRGSLDRAAAALDTIRANADLQQGYGPGNSLNLLCQGDMPPAPLDFSGLTIRQAYLKGVQLHGANFTHTTWVDPALMYPLGRIGTVAFSPNGAWLATGSNDATVRLWDVATATCSHTLTGHTSAVHSVAFSPDGAWLATGSSDATIRLWDVATATCRHVLRGHGAAVFSVAWCPMADLPLAGEGPWLASGSADTTVRLWDAATGTCCSEFTGHTHWVDAVSFIPVCMTSLGGSGCVLASGGYDFSIRLWHVDSGTWRYLLADYNLEPRTVAFSPCGHWLAASCRLTFDILIASVSTGECHTILKGHTRGCRTIAFSPDGHYLASGGRDDTVRLWDIRTGTCHQTLTGHTAWVRSVAFSPDGQWLATSSDDSTVCLWDVVSGQCHQTFSSHSNWINGVAFSPNEDCLATASNDGVVRLWSLGTASNCQTMASHNSKYVDSVAYSPDGQWIATGGDDQAVWLWQLPTGQCHSVRTVDSKGSIKALEFSPDGTYLAFGRYSAQIWHMADHCLIQVLSGHTAGIMALAYSPDGAWLATSSRDATTRLWDVHTGQCIGILQDGNSWVNAVAFSPDGAWLATGSGDAVLRLWDVRQQICTQRLQGHTTWITAVAFSPDGTEVASGSEDATLRLWSLASADCRVLRGHRRGVRTVAYSPSGQQIATGSGDATARLWQRATGECVQIFASPRPYEGTDITATTGLTAAQHAALIALGAVDHAPASPDP